MADDPNGYRTPAGREKALDEHEGRLDALEAWKKVSEFKEQGREKRVNRAITAVSALAISIASGIAVALFSGGHL